MYFSTKEGKEGFKISNLLLIAVIGVLGTGILFDGTLYNKSPVQTSIHSFGEAQSISLHFESELILGLHKSDDNWLISQPAPAPALTERVQVLLDTNNYSQRQYSLSEVPREIIFADPVQLKINNTEYIFGTVEPVSKLRYVRSGDSVYLQPDTVIPLLTAANNAFVDLKITDKVDRISIGGNHLPRPDAWSNLKAIDIVDIEPAESALDLTLVSQGKTVQLSAQKSEPGYTIHSDDGFSYLLDTSIAESLGLVELLATAN